MSSVAAHLIKKGEEVILIGVELEDKSPATRLGLVDENNKFVRYL